MGVSADFVLNYGHKSRFNLLRSVVFELFVMLMGGGLGSTVVPPMKHHYIMFPRFVTNLILRLLLLPKERNYDLLVVYSAGCRLWSVMAVILISDIRIGSDWTISVPGCWRRPSVHW